MFLNRDNSLKFKWIGIATLIVVVVCLLGIFWFDRPVYLLLRGFGWSGWGFFDAVFATKVWLIASAIVALLIFLKKNLKSKDDFKINIKKFNLREFFISFIAKLKDNLGFLVFCSVFLAAIDTAILKFILGRARPVFLEALDHTGFYPFTNEWAFNSMPSGHASASFAGLVMIGLLFPKIKWATWTLAIIIGASRICYGAHFPTDVILGAFIGMLSADLVRSFFVTYKSDKK